jgi:hypothetical protein
MNINELKAEANALGYSITKKITYEKLLPCPCGNSRWVTSQIAVRGKYYRCSRCDYTSKVAKYKYEAIQNWNKAVRDLGAYQKHQEEKFKELMEAQNETYRPRI